MSVPSQQGVAIVLVSHSKILAQAVADLAGQMTQGKVPILCAAGAGDDGSLFGTDAMKIMEAIESVNRPEGVLVLMDLGSALLSTDMALDFLDNTVKANVHVLPCAFVEGAVTAAASAAAGAPIGDIIREAEQALSPKFAHLKPIAAQTEPQADRGNSSEAGEKKGEIAIADPNGLHARPAAQIATLAGSFQSKVMIANKTRQTGPVSAKSLVGLSSLGALHNDILEVSASGPDAEQAVSAFIALIATLKGDQPKEKTPEPDIQAADKKSEVPAESDLQGGALPASAGIAFGPVHYLQQAIPVIPDNKIKPEETAKEKQRLAEAAAAVQQRLETQSKKSDIFTVQLMLLQDPDLMNKAQAYIADGHDNAAKAWNRAVDEAAGIYQKLEDPYLKQRATDVYDVGNSVLRVLLGVETLELPRDHKYVLVADELTPTDAAHCDPDYVLGVVDRKGGRTSHASILLRAAGIPLVVGAASVPDKNINEIALDGSTGEIWLNPEGEIRTRIQEKYAEWQKKLDDIAQEARLDAVTKDGKQIALLANVSGIVDAKAANKAGAKGVGLLRTEILFADRKKAPDEAEQVSVLSEIFDVYKGFPIVVRTLDAGGDKPLSYIQMDKEANPFLGERGIRLSFSHPELFETQLRAILRAAIGHDVRIMLPMITEVAEIRNARSVLEAVHKDLQEKSVPHAWPVPLGVMIEVPAAAIRADKMADYAEFFSIGTNDLTQYVLAAERGNPHLGSFSDPVHPAVLDMIRKVADAGKAKGRHVSVCGEAAGDPKAAALLVGLGVTSLSMGGASLADVRRMIRGHGYDEFGKAAEKALEQNDAAGVRDYLKNIF